MKIIVVGQLVFSGLSDAEYILRMVTPEWCKSVLARRNGLCQHSSSLVLKCSVNGVDLVSISALLGFIV